MLDVTTDLAALVVLLLASVAGWLFSVVRRNVTIVDSLALESRTDGGRKICHLIQ
jgi:hypothetical protein